MKVHEDHERIFDDAMGQKATVSKEVYTSVPRRNTTYSIFFYPIRQYVVFQSVKFFWGFAG